jgi:methionine-rich copper-binding protein CopC
VTVRVARGNSGMGWAPGPRLSRPGEDATVAGVSRVFFVAAWAVVVGLSPASPASPASAHAFLVRSLPAARTSVARVPERVRLWFNERLEPAYSHVTVWSASAERVDAGDAQVTPAEPTRLSVGVPALPAGVYTVKYRVLSVDGHVVEAEFAFTVRGAP